MLGMIDRTTDAAAAEYQKNRIAFWDEKNGILAGDPVDGRLVVLRTADGGATWRAVDSMPKIKGRAPKAPTAIQPKETMAMPSRVLRESTAFPRKLKYMAAPQAAVMDMAMAMGMVLPSP